MKKLPKVDIKKIFKQRKFWASILLAQFLLFYILSKIPQFISCALYFFEFQKKIHQSLFAWIPFSLGDALYIILGCYLILLFLGLFSRERRKQAVLHLLLVINVLTFLYQIFWGLLYFQKPIQFTTSHTPISLQEKKIYAQKYLQLCKETRTLAHEDKKGVFEISNLSRIKSEILYQQGELPQFNNRKSKTNVNAFKVSLYRPIMSYTGILGYYNPFTAEAQYNPKLPDSYLPFTLAHESAHQLGYAREQEANFIGFLIGINTKNTELKYSTEFFVLKSVLRSIVNDDPQFVKQQLQNFSPAMKRDWNYEQLFMKQHEGYLDQLFTTSNDLFLQSNQQEGAITYSYFVNLFIFYQRTISEKN